MAIGDVIARLSVVLGMDTALFEKGASLSEKRLAQMERKFSQLGDKISGLGQKLSLGITLPLAAFGASAANAASDAAELQSAFDQTFGQMSATMNKWAEDTGNALGRSTQEMQKAANTFGIFFNTAVDPAKAAEMSQVFAQLAQDLGSFYNTDTQTAIDKLRSGLSGESEPLRDFGVFLTEANVKAKALELGLTGVGNELTEQEKILARYQLILEATTNAQGDVERTSGGTANKIRSAKAAFEELQVAIGTKLLPVITPLIDKIAGLLGAFTSLPSSMQTAIIVIGGLAAALGPVLVAVGALTSALGPLAVLITASIIPAITKFGFAAAAAVTQFGILHGSIGILTVSIRALIVTLAPWALAIGAVTAAVYILYKALTEKTAAAHAAEVQSARNEAALRTEEAATRQLAQAKGEERNATIAAMQASRARAAQSLQTAKALQAETKAAFSAARASLEQRVQRQANSAGAGFKVDPRSVARNENTLILQPAEREIRAAEIRIAKAEGAIQGIDKAIASATAPVVLPQIATGLGKVADATDRVGRSAASAASAANPLRDVLDKLFPAEADMRQAEADLAVLKKALDSGKISAERYSDAVAQLWRNFLGANGPPEEQIETVLGGETIQQISDGITGRFAEAMDRLNEKAGLTKVQVVKTFKEMADETLSAFSRLSDAIQGGGFLSILEAVAGLGLQLGSIGLFGKRVQTNINKAPGFANGTSFAPGGFAVVGERGPELVDLPRGSRVTPNNDLRGMGGIAAIVPSPYFDVVVDGRIVRASPAIASAGAQGGVAQIRRSGTRRVA